LHPCRVATKPPGQFLTSHQHSTVIRTDRGGKWEDEAGRVRTGDQASPCCVLDCSPNTRGELVLDGPPTERFHRVAHCRSHVWRNLRPYPRTFPSRTAAPVPIWRSAVKESKALPPGVFIPDFANRQYRAAVLGASFSSFRGGHGRQGLRGGGGDADRPRHIDKPVSLHIRPAMQFGSRRDSAALLLQL
jgi:hypothetical protein